MLKRLELVGFKSFAERTQFDFARGLTAVVGPNGSGKSNVVDAVRWILGEQSAKSLRGSEMADVIFNGSASRRAVGMAEVTMILDNSSGVLAVEGSEVQVTRRVYRDGEGEYLINGQASRLRDIKEMFLGSGAGTDAYCIIEQGRVEVLLQASTKERRVIFEEAAGISRFKARKTETLRKLERVTQNLQRLQDIVEEVEKQLRSVKLQASKAQRYQEHTHRLRELRVGLGLTEYHQLTTRLRTEQAVLATLRAELHTQADQAEAWETAIRRLEEALHGLEQAIHHEESDLAQAREQITAEETTLGHEQTLTADLETELVRTRGRVTRLNTLVNRLAAEAAEAGAAHTAAEEQCHRQRQTVRELEDDLRATVNRMTVVQHQQNVAKQEHLEQMRGAARLQNDAISVKAQADNLRRERDRLQARGHQAAESLASLDLELQDLNAADETLQGRLATARDTLAKLRQDREQLRRLVEDESQRLADLRAQRSGWTSRIDLLEGLERSHEGLGSGAREVFALLEQPDAGPWRTLLAGLVADVFTVAREHAALIDLALGERAQRFLVRDPAQLEQALAQLPKPFSGRVSFLPLPFPDKPSDTRAVENPAGSATPVAEVARIRDSEHPNSGDFGYGPRVFDRAVNTLLPAAQPADQLVTCEAPDFADLPARLLGTTLVVPDLATARTLAATTPGARFVTRQGELLEADGTLTVGMHHAEAGIISRKSELRDLRQQVLELDQHLQSSEKTLASLRERIVTHDTRAASAQEEITVLGEQAADLRERIAQHRQRRDGLHEEVELSRSEMSGLEREIEELDVQWRQARGLVEEAERQVQALQAQMEQADRELHDREQHRQQRQLEVTEARVALAQVEERLAALRARHRQAENDLETRRQERTQAGQHLTASQTRQTESLWTMLHASTRLAVAYLRKETAERQLSRLQGERDGCRQERHMLAEQTQAARAAWKAQQEQAHARELEVNALGHQCDTLTERLREDYQLDLRPSPNGDRCEAVDAVGAALPIEPLPEEQKPVAEEEIAELRRKLSRLGSVNLDALQELAELEQRAAELHAQHDDLTAAKRSLDEIITKINQDSRRLFQETFTTIRGHFQELFRKLFGGGMADVLLEDENDILECGIEINARPPGKELRSISLMSGGEKTMTAVALLLAIFRSKPSPFCILDEVDAALDEANIGRFVAVLREFLDRSQFILITHSKRTMAAADVLYGVTMQESGVSKRVAVRFEDFPEDGEPVTVSSNGNKSSFAGR